MRPSTLVVFLVSALISRHSFGTDKNTTTYNGARCIANVCPGNEKVVTVSEIAEILGKGHVITISGNTFTCLNFSKDGFLYLINDDHQNANSISTIFLSQRSNCYLSKSGKVKSTELVTEKGIGLGSAEAAVIAAYGKPTAVANRSGVHSDYWYIGKNGLTRKTVAVTYFGDKVLLYSGKDLDSSRFFIKNGKVSAIMVSYSE